MLALFMQYLPVIVQYVIVPLVLVPLGKAVWDHFKRSAASSDWGNLLDKLGPAVEHTVNDLMEAEKRKLDGKPFTPEKVAELEGAAIQTVTEHFPELIEAGKDVVGKGFQKIVDGMTKKEVANHIADHHDAIEKAATPTLADAVASMTEAMKAVTPPVVPPPVDDIPRPAGWKP